MQLEQLQLELQLELQVEHDDEDDEEREGRIRPMVSSGFLVTRAECPESKRGFCLAQSNLVQIDEVTWWLMKIVG